MLSRRDYLSTEMASDGIVWIRCRSERLSMTVW